MSDIDHDQARVWAETLVTDRSGRYHETSVNLARAYLDLDKRVCEMEATLDEADQVRDDAVGHVDAARKYAIEQRDAALARAHKAEALAAHAHRLALGALLNRLGGEADAFGWAKEDEVFRHVAWLVERERDTAIARIESFEEATRGGLLIDVTQAMNTARERVCELEHTLDTAIARAEKAEAEVARLREALERLLVLPTHDWVQRNWQASMEKRDDECGDWLYADTVHEVARAALEPKP